MAALLAGCGSVRPPMAGVFTSSLARQAEPVEPRVRLQVGGVDALDALGPYTRVTEPSGGAVTRLMPVVQEVLRLYEGGARDTLFPEVWLVGELDVAGRPYLGLAQPERTRLVLALREATTEEGLTRTMHHEIAHLVDAAGHIDHVAWESISHGRYKGSMPRAAWAREDDWIEHGFVSAYASKNIPEDIAELAEASFVRPEHVRRLARLHPSVARKLALLTGAYQEVAPALLLPWDVLESPTEAP